MHHPLAPHPLAAELVRSRFLADSPATFELLLLLSIEKSPGVVADQIRATILMDLQQIKQALQRLVDNGDIVESDAKYDITDRGRARSRFMLVDYYHEIVEMESLLVGEITSRFRKLAEAGIRTVAIYPVGETANVAIHGLKAAGIQVAVALDDAHSMWGKGFHEITVCAPEELLNVRVDAVILTTCVFQVQLRKHLQALGVSVPIFDF